MSEPNRNAIDEALARYLDGEPEPGDIELLGQAMQADDRFAREVARLLTVDNLLEQRATGDSRGFLDVLETRLAAEQEGRRFLGELARRLRREGAPAARRRHGRSWAAVAAVFVLSALAVLPWAARRRGAGPVRPMALATAVEPLAMVTQLDAAQWEPEGGRHPAEGDVLGARRLWLRHGRVVLSFLSGVTLTVEGPADLDLIAIDRVFCRTGKLRARVPAGAEGFLVTSANSGVTDLGTEFSLALDANGRSRVVVVEGAAELALLDAKGAPQRTQHVEETESFELDPKTGRITEVVGEPVRIVPALAPLVPALPLNPRYADAVMESRPRAYWRFGEMAGSAIPNELPGGPPLRVNGPLTVERGPEGSGCVVFKASADEQCLTMDGAWELPREPGHAAEFWFLADRFEHAGLVGLYPPLELNPKGYAKRYAHLLFVELLAYQRQSLHPPATVRVHHRWPPHLTEENNLYSSIYAPARWHHVVAQMAGGRMELYYDGVPSFTTPEPMAQPGLPCRLVVGRKTPDPLNRGDCRPFVGRLAELALYDHPLSDKEIRTHYQLVKP